MIDQICSSFLEVISKEGQAASKWITPYTAPSANDLNQFVLFIKPRSHGTPRWGRFGRYGRAGHEYR